MKKKVIMSLDENSITEITINTVPLAIYGGKSI